MTLPLPLPDLPGALCAETDPELFFPGYKGSPHAAVALCSLCESREPCLAWAMDNPSHGVWGGTTVRQRQRIAARQGRTYEPSRPVILAGPQPGDRATDPVRARQSAAAAAARARRAAS